MQKSEELSEQCSAN